MTAIKAEQALVMPSVMAFCKAPLALLLLVFISCCQQNDAQLIANIKNFLSNIPTFGSKDVPKFSTDGQYAPTPRLPGLDTVVVMPKSSYQWPDDC